MSKPNSVLAIVLAGCFLLVGCSTQSAGQSEGQSPNIGHEVSLAEAEAIYQANCVACHAVDLGGGVGPSLQKVGGILTRAQIAEQIVAGGSKMPAFRSRLTKEEVDALARWLATQK
ncbi:cytochrome c [Paenibacillaceae bacterium]|nr:cytochrome c [Paenibacillaceae bacterium]